jgi:hypothetical protein
MKTTLIGGCLFALNAAMLFGQESRGHVGVSEGNYAAGCKAGVAEAEKELKEGKATLYTYGLRDRDGIEDLDRKTGLPFEAIAGCVVYDKLLGRAAGHNRRIAKYIEEHGLPSNSFKRWEKELFDLESYFAKRRKTEKPIPLIVGLPAEKSPDGKYAMRRAQKPRGLIVSVDGIDHKALWISYGNIDFFWGPKDSGFAVIRTSGVDGTSFMAVDFKRGRRLRETF